MIEMQVDTCLNGVFEYLELIIRPLNSSSTGEIEIVAERMKETLIEVLDADRGQNMYSKEWLIDRVKQHLDGRLRGQVFLAIYDKQVVGHTIIRVENSNDQNFGFFSTIYVAPEYRNSSIATQLIELGEEWMRGNNLKRFVTYTSNQNDKLVGLFKKQGYRVTAEFPEKNMIEIAK